MSLKKHFEENFRFLYKKSKNGFEFYWSLVEHLRLQNVLPLRFNLGYLE